MESAPEHRHLNCSACGASFDCYPAPGANCWCANVDIPGSTLIDLKSKFADCICRNCLAKYSKKEPSAKA